VTTITRQSQSYQRAAEFIPAVLESRQKRNHSNDLLDNQLQTIAPQFAPIPGNTNIGIKNASARVFHIRATLLNANLSNDLQQLFQNQTLSNNQKTPSATHVLSLLGARAIQ
jgi:hypothetical protein